MNDWGANFVIGILIVGCMIWCAHNGAKSRALSLICRNGYLYFGGGYVCALGLLLIFSGTLIMSIETGDRFALWTASMRGGFPEGFYLPIKGKNANFMAFLVTCMLAIYLYMSTRYWRKFVKVYAVELTFDLDQFMSRYGTKVQLSKDSLARFYDCTLSSDGKQLVRNNQKITVEEVLERVA